jgi:Predicted AdoMet-dependent methyltransferase
MVLQIWTESTDPQKFVYEDIGIAAYLIVSFFELNTISIIADLISILLTLFKFPQFLFIIIGRNFR